jgi:DNA gyrase subunit A
MSASGVVIRTKVDEIRIIGRGTKGVRIMRLDEGDKVIGMTIVPHEEQVVDEEPPAE